MEPREFLAAIAGLVFIYVIIWYLTLNDWLPGSYLSPIGQILGLCALVVTGLFIVSQIRGED